MTGLLPELNAATAGSMLRLSFAISTALCSCLRYTASVVVRASCYISNQDYSSTPASADTFDDATQEHTLHLPICLPVASVREAEIVPAPLTEEGSQHIPPQPQTHQMHAFAGQQIEILPDTTLEAPRHVSSKSKLPGTKSSIRKAQQLVSISHAQHVLCQCRSTAPCQALECCWTGVHTAFLPPACLCIAAACADHQLACRHPPRRQAGSGCWTASTALKPCPSSPGALTQQLLCQTYRTAAGAPSPGCGARCSRAHPPSPAPHPLPGSAVRGLPRQPLLQQPARRSPATRPAAPAQQGRRQSAPSCAKVLCEAPQH